MMYIGLGVGYHTENSGSLVEYCEQVVAFDGMSGDCKPLSEKDILYAIRDFPFSSTI